jgi:hypothetical protein
VWNEPVELMGSPAYFDPWSSGSGWGDPYLPFYARYIKRAADESSSQVARELRPYNATHGIEVAGRFVGAGAVAAKCRRRLPTSAGVPLSHDATGTQAREERPAAPFLGPYLGGNQRPCHATDTLAMRCRRARRGRGTRAAGVNRCATRSWNPRK